MLKIFSNPAQIVTVNTSGKNYKRGKEQSDIGTLSGYSLVVEDDLIKDFIPNSSVKNYDTNEIIDVRDKLILPGLIDCHTHTAFAGTRSEEFKERLKGKTYEEIAKAGGGINKTVAAVRRANTEQLINLISPRIDYFISQGVTSLEIKSGYGLNFENEMKLLKVISFLNNNYEIDIIPTFLGAHTYPPEFKDNHRAYIDMIVNDMLLYISNNDLAKFCDGFCEATAFSLTELEEIFRKAKSNGLAIKIHTDQFRNLGGVDLALNLKAVSADHLEVVDDEDIKKLGNSEIVCVLLPGSSFFLNENYAPARKLINNNAIVALSTDYNPGSSNISNLNLIMSIAALKMKMTIEETISAVTINAAKALMISEDKGSIEIGKKADLAIFNTNDYADIVYIIGKNLNYMTVKNGNVIYIAD